ncbi:polysaccharide biosynthesis protein [Paenibacillus silviterrae]|uniref:polysaccharide biosynthesis protein n=1 Tax=Paenibacillus silviterrae TaxID=3242194 RepID=UPI00254375A6|nr:nucleoside-diphosphate sugar epimerase/dehydratase [Paenibacillus chinjuensis]
MNRYQRKVLLVLIDVMTVSLSVYIAFLLRFDFDIKSPFIDYLPYVIFMQTFITILFFFYHNIYKRLWQYASVGDIVTILKSVLYSTSVFFIFHHYIVKFYIPEIIVPRSIYIISALITIFGVGGSRFLWRSFRSAHYKQQPHHRRALIIGAGNTGSMVLKEMKHTTNSIYFPVAFIDDDPKKYKLEIQGVSVLGNRHNIPAVVEKLMIEDIIIAMPSATRAELIEIIDICRTTGAKINIVPRINDLITGKLSISHIRDVSVEDLLGREPVKINLDEIASYLYDKVVLVTGAGGSIGSELCRQIANFGPKQLLLLGHGENSIYEIELELKKKHPELIIEPIIADIQDKGRLKRVFSYFQPEVVFHAAAHKHVPLMEKNPMEAVKNNIVGTKNVAECAHEFNALKFVMISTDKAVNPTNVMGATKRIAELIIQSLDKVSDTQFSAVRFGNVLGSRGSVIPIFKKQIQEGGPVTITHPEMVRYFMTIPEAVQLVIQTGALAMGGEVFILDMGKPVKISDLAIDLVKLSGLEPHKDIEIVYSGIRPGEKLFEELLTNEEGTSATKHDRIYVGMPTNLSDETMKLIIETIEALVLKDGNVGPAEVKATLQKILPAYVSAETINRAREEALQASLEVVAGINRKSK